ncbi:MAG: ABC transporter ATP-binding protein [Acidimicrobiales bacterium]
MAWRMSLGVGEEEKLGVDGARKVARRTGRALGAYRVRLIAASTALITWTLLTLAGPLLVRRAIDRGLRVGDRTQLNITVALYIVVALAAYATYRLAIINLAHVGEGFLRDLRNQVFDRMLKQSLSFFDREKSGVLISRMTSDIDSLQDLVQFGLLMFVSAALLLTLSAVVLAFLSWQLLAICLITTPVIVAASIKFHRDSNRAYVAVRDNVGLTLNSLQEGISGVRIVQAFARERIEADRFAATNRALYLSHMDSVRIAAWYLPIIEFTGALTTAVALGVGGVFVVKGIITLGTVAAFVLILQTLFGPVQQLSQLFNLVQSATAALNKLFDLIDAPIEVDEAADAVALDGPGSIELDGVGFSYTNDPQDMALTDIDLTIGAGERIAFVGPTGAGKSSLAKLVARFYDPTVGTVRVDGIDLTRAQNRSLRSKIVVVPQEGFLFSGTILDNIRIAKPAATDDEIRAAVERIGAAEIFDGLPDGLATEVQERGSRLSAGEKQIVSLARAALVDPAILILDEATSSVDPGTEALVENAMDSLMRSRTVIVIAHRLSTAARCDRVGVIVDGRLAELGTHDELLTRGEHYTELFAAWSKS